MKIENQINGLLKGTSRSFYFTLRILPSRVRGIISLAYLLARASDTIADTATLSLEDRLTLLRQLPSNWQENLSHEDWNLVPSETELLNAVPVLLECLTASSEREEILLTWQTILEGQIFDLERFARGDAAPLTLEELDRYTYLVAGCVGEFWTRVCFKQIPNYSFETKETLCALGRRFGQGLQLVNILRDRHADAANRRIYVVEEHFESVMEQARADLDAGKKYVAALVSKRLRVACALPIEIGLRTLDLIKKNPSWPKAKISRNTLLKVALHALKY